MISLISSLVSNIIIKYPHGDEIFNVIATFVCADYEGELREDQDEVLSLQFFSIDDLPSNLNPPEIPIIHEYIQSRGIED